MRQSIRLAALLLASAGLGAEAQSGIHPALQAMGPLRTNEACHEAARAPGVPEALSAATRVVVRTDGHWQKVAPALEVLAGLPRFADCASQQAIASVALQAVLLDAPPEADDAVAKQLHRLIEHDGISFVAMVEALDRVRGDLPAATVRAYERAIAARYAARFGPACDGCDPVALEALRQRAAEADDDRSIFDRMPPERRAQVERQIQRHVAARERIADWSD